MVSSSASIDTLSMNVHVFNEKVALHENFLAQKDKYQVCGFKLPLITYAYICFLFRIEML